MFHLSRSIGNLAAHTVCEKKKNLSVMVVGVKQCLKCMYGVLVNVKVALCSCSLYE